MRDVETKGGMHAEVQAMHCRGCLVDLQLKVLALV